MVTPKALECEVIRVTRPDTLLVRTFVPSVTQKLCVYATPMATANHKKECQQAILDWVELHADNGVLLLDSHVWWRDSYGRLLADFLDVQSKESMCDYLIEHEYCEVNPNHVHDCLSVLLNSQEPRDV